MVAFALKKVTDELQKNYQTFENLLLSPSSCENFKKFLANYRGHSCAVETAVQMIGDHSGQQFLEGFSNFFKKIFQELSLESISQEHLLSILLETEKHVNLLLYYWFGLNDRNYQFRTLIHFFHLEKAHSILFSVKERNYVLFFTEEGMGFDVQNFMQRELHCLPVSKILGLLELLQIPCCQRTLFARIRTVQREIFLLVDHWEHLNSILAVEYGSVLSELERHPGLTSEQKFAQILLKMNFKRDSLATWCLESFCDIQEWCTQLFKLQNLSQNIVLELDATSALLLASIQKIFLPASVSKHCYCDRVSLLLKRFALSRVEMDETDVSSHLLLQAVLSSLGEEFSFSLLNFIEKKPFEWKLSHNPSSALKAFSWRYSQEHHLLLCFVYSICCFKKISPDLMDEMLFADVVATIQMRETFPPEAIARTVHPSSFSFSREEFQKILFIFEDHLQKSVKKTKQTIELMKILQPDLQLLKGLNL
jgi:hypothetical protein